MKKAIKKIICMILCFAMIFTTLQTTMFSASAKVVGPDNKTELTITTDKSKYSWGDTITFTITVKNKGQDTIDYATISAVPKYSRFFDQASTKGTTVVNLASGQSESVIISFKSHCSAMARIFMPFIRLFNIGITNGYRTGNFDKTQKASLGIFPFEFGFSVNYGFESTATGQEVENIKKINNNQLPDIYMDTEDSIPSFIDGKFSDKTIKNESDALSSLNDIKNLMGFDDINNELHFYQKDSYGGNTFYRFQQYYNGIEVYGKNLIVAVDNGDKTSALSNDYEPNIEIDITPTISEDKAINIASSYITDIKNVSSKGLRIYATETSPTLVYMITCDGKYGEKLFSGSLFIDANLAYVIANENLISYETVTASTDDMTFAAWKNSGGTYELIDKTRNIYVYDANRSEADVNVNDSRTSFTIRSGASLATSSNKDQWNSETARMMYNLSKIYDYYQNHYSISSFNRANGQLIAIANDGFDSGNNGYSMSDIASPNTVIAIGYNTGCYRYDVLAHEYLHSTERYIANMTGGDNETGGLKEAYADIMGEVLEADVLNGNVDWMHGTSRNIANPSKTSNPSKVPLVWISHECHYISTIISHAAYLMQQDKITDMNRLGELWYRSMYYLDSNSSFEDCRAAVVASARDMGMSNDEITCVQSAFDNVGVKGTFLGSYGFSSISGKVLDSSTLNPIAGAQVVALKTAPNNWGAGIVETGSDGGFEITGLSSGTYSISVSAPGYRVEMKYDITVGAFSSVSLSSSILLSLSVADNGALGGKITNAIDGQVLSDATIKFRNNHGNKTGSYVTVNGSVLQLKTDISGKYECDNIKTGYYTMEISKEGFITGYFDVFAAPSNNICKNQNFSISPELPEGQYRIVLTWGNNPRDLDSHITGITSSGSSFHVYYSNKNAWDEDVHVANLDVDDTNGEGPETVTLIPTTAQTYRYYVYRYDGDGSISTSGAHIEVYKGNTRIAMYDAPTNQGTGDYWTVFEITNGQIKAINKISNNP